MLSKTKCFTKGLWNHLQIFVFLHYAIDWSTPIHGHSKIQAGTGDELKNRMFLFKTSPLSLICWGTEWRERKTEREQVRELRGNELNFSFRHMLLIPLFDKQGLILQNAIRNYFWITVISPTGFRTAAVMANARWSGQSWVLGESIISCNRQPVVKWAGIHFPKWTYWLVQLMA